MKNAINDRIIELLQRRLQQDSLQEEEQKELQEWINRSPENESLYRELTDEQSFAEALEKFSAIDTEASLLQVRQRIFGDKEAEVLPMIQPNQKPMRRIVSAAAIILILLSAGILYFQLPDKSGTAKTNASKPNTELIPPGGDKTRLTLSNGSEYDLDSSQNGKLVIEESAIIHGEKLLYEIANANNTAGEVKLNTLANPRGLIKQLILPDNSVVWLSSVSAVRFPDKFSGSERRIELVGEAEFEITKDPSKPFIVQVISEKGEPRGTAIKVLGTHFTISAYGNDPSINTTLMEGSVEVLHKEKSVRLKPNQQAIVKDDGSIKITDKLDVQAVAERSKGLFIYDSVPMETIMKQVTRLFNLDVEYSDSSVRKVAYKIILVNDGNIGLLLESLNKSDDFVCELSGRKLILSAKEKVPSIK